MPTTAVDPEMAAESPKKPLVAPSAAVSWACWDQAVPGRVNTCAALVPELWRGAPATVVDPETASEWPKKSPRRRRSCFSIVGGIASSAGVVTSAALIMVALFSMFSTLQLVDLKILGVGTAAAVLIDATVVRGVLVPAALALLGDRAWRLRRGGNRGGTATAPARVTLVASPAEKQPTSAGRPRRTPPRPARDLASPAQASAAGDVDDLAGDAASRGNARNGA